jgi:hypothetical protein
LHASYLESGGKKVERDQVQPEHFANWVGWAKRQQIGLDFNQTFFSHPKAADGFTLAHADEGIRRFWVEHGIACRKIGEALGRELGKTKTVILSTHILSEVELTCQRAIIVNQGKVVADATLEELRGHLKGARRRYLFAVAGEAAGTDAERLSSLKALPGVGEVQKIDRGMGEPTTFAVTASVDDDLRPALHRLATAHDWPVLELHREMPTLEQVFVRLTQEVPTAGAGN